MPLYNDGVSVNKQTQDRYFSCTEIFNYTNGDKFFTNKLKLIPIPTILYKVCLMPNDRHRIEIVENTVIDLKGKKIPWDYGKLISMANLLGEFSERVDLWIGLDNEVIFASKANKTNLKLDDLEETAIDLTEETVIKLINSANIGAYYFALDDDKNCYHIGKNILYKTAYNFMMSWFDNLYPGILVADNAPKSVKITQEGMKLLTYFYLKESGVKTLDVFLTDYPEELIFSLEEKYAHKLCTSRMKITTFLDKKIPDEMLDAIPDNKDSKEKTSIIHYPEGYQTNVCTKLVSDSPRIMPAANVSWNCFLANYKKFYDMCQVVFAKNEIVLDENDKNVVGWNDTEKIIFYGYEYEEIPKRNSIEIIMKEEPSNAFIYGIKEYFNKLGISIFCIKVPASNKFIFESRDIGDNDDRPMMFEGFDRRMFES